MIRPLLIPPVEHYGCKYTKKLLYRRDNGLEKCYFESKMKRRQSNYMVLLQFS